MEHIHEDKQGSLEEQRMQALDMAKSGNPRQAEKLLRQVVAGWESAQPPNDVMHTQALRNLGSVLCALNRGFTAEQLPRAALQVCSGPHPGLYCCVAVLYFKLFLCNNFYKADWGVMPHSSCA